MTRVYLSSTYEDLKDYRSAVFEALRKAGYEVAAMEEYVAADQRPVDQCLADVKKSDVYVGIFAFRYGYIPPKKHQNPEGLSISELEFRHAERLGKPCLTFIVKEGTPWSLNYLDAYTERKQNQPGHRIEHLREYLLREKSAAFFSTPHELASLVQAAITRQLEKMQVDRPETTAAPPAVIWKIEERGSPFPGLLHFTRKYAPVFFGREGEVRDILDRLNSSQARFLIVSGNSGTGKSSLIDAGVLPRLEESGIAGRKRCLCVRMVPSQGDHPFDALMRPLNGLAQQAGIDPYALSKELLEEPDTFLTRIQTLIAEGIPDGALVVFLDQMEELFTGIQDEPRQEQSNAFLSALYDAATIDQNLWVIATIRSDFLHFCETHRKLLEVFRYGGHYPIGRAEPHMVRDMIEKPAACAGLSLSDALIHRLIEDTGSEPGNLPLLAFVLERLFEEREGSLLSEERYQAFGGVEGAIQGHVSEVEDTIEKKLRGRALDKLPHLFRSLLVVNADGQPTRRRAVKKDFTTQLQPLVDQLVQGRLLVAEGDGETSTVSVAHEKLFESWPSLARWIMENRDELMMRNLLQVLTNAWQDRGRPRLRDLATPSQLRSFRQIRDPSSSEKGFLRASRQAAGLRRGALVAFAGLMLLLAGFVWWINDIGITPGQGASLLLVHVGIDYLGPQMVELPTGEYRRQYTKRGIYSEESPMETVTISRPFAVSKYEVTFDEYDVFARVTGHRLPSDSGWGRGNRPVTFVSWEDAKAYAEWLSEQTGRRYRLLTEAEWEYAARAGSDTAYWWGDEIGQGRANCVGCGSEWDGEMTAPAGSFEPSAFGLYDLVGNVSEWVEDCRPDYYEGPPLDVMARLEEAGGDCRWRLARGGSWNRQPDVLAPAPSVRYFGEPDRGYPEIGIRLAQDLD